MQEWERKFTPSRKDILEKAFILNSDIEEGGSGSFNFIRQTLKDYYANDIDTYYAKVRKLREIKDDEGKLSLNLYLDGHLRLIQGGPPSRKNDHL